jgi:Na+-transporting NADH:ubiquinone oxidoreductase subunit NqrE
MWAAAICGVAVACSLGLALLHWVIIAMSCAMIFEVMLMVNRDYWPGMRESLRQSRPGTAWALMLIAAIFLYVSLTPSRRKSREPSRRIP